MGTMDVTVAHIFAHYMPTLFHARTDTYITSVYNILESLEDFFELHAIRLKEPIQDYFNYLINPLSEEGILKIVVDPDRATRGKIQEVLSGNQDMTEGCRHELNYAYVIVDVDHFEAFTEICRLAIKNEVDTNTKH